MVYHDQTARMAQTLLDFRRIRPDALPSGLFSETGWELLLELFIADANGARLTGRQFASENGAYLSTTSRWMKALTAEGLIQGDGNGEVDDPIMLTGKGLQQMEALMEQARALQLRLQNT